MAQGAHAELAQREIPRMVETHGDNLFRLCYMQLLDLQQAQDAVQETFLKAYRAFGQYRDEGMERAWLTRIAINTCKDMRKSAWFRFVDRRKTLESLPEPCIPFTQRDQTIAEAVARLKPQLREIVVLYYFQELSASEIAQIKGIKTRAVYTLLNKAKDTLNKRLRRWYYYDE